MPISIEDHIWALKKMLNSQDPCDGMNCPAIQLSRRDNPGVENCFHAMACSTYKHEAMCQEFVGIFNDDENNLPGCPCHELGREEALKVTMLKIEEYESE